MEFFAPPPPSFDPSPLPSSTPPSSSSVAPPPPLPFHHEWHRPGDTGLEETMWRLSPGSQEGVDSAYPERPGEPDCAYYMRTGLCGFGINCKFNHPPNRRLASSSVTSRSRGEYPERLGQPDCQYYLKTGTCKFGATCKYHHPREKAGLAGRAQLNVLNLPLRPGERDCAYYMRTGNCKYGVTCKFNHPQPVSMPSSPIFPGAGSGSAPAPQPFPAGLPAWTMARPPFYPPPRLAGPSNFAPVFLPPQGVLSVPGWNPYQSPLVAQEGQQQGLPYMYSAAPSHDPAVMGLHAAFPPFMQGSSVRPPAASTIAPQEALYPERPGQPDCHYYMRTGECRFGSQCRFHHPRDRNVPAQASLLSPMGLPLRPGLPPCTFYSRYGFCKFGPTCKFDHPFVHSPSSLVEHPVGQYATGLSASAVPNVLPSAETPRELLRHPSTSATAGFVSELALSSSGGAGRQSSSRQTFEESDVLSEDAAASSPQGDIHGSS